MVPERLSGNTGINQKFVGIEKVQTYKNFVTMQMWDTSINTITK